MMSGTSSPGPAPDALELAALLCFAGLSRSHQPGGAIVNGLEVLDDNRSRKIAILRSIWIRKSAKTASARLQFCRLALARRRSAGAQIDLGDAQTMARGTSRTARSPSPGICRACAAEEPRQAAAEHA
jgi:histidine phosphotransferase ChpT